MPPENLAELGKQETKKHERFLSGPEREALIKRVNALAENQEIIKAAKRATVRIEATDYFKKSVSSGFIYDEHTIVCSAHGIDKKCLTRIHFFEKDDEDLLDDRDEDGKKGLRKKSETSYKTIVPGVCNSHKIILDRNKDIAVIYFEKPVFESAEPLGITETMPEKHSPILTVGHPDVQQHRVWISSVGYLEYTGGMHENLTSRIVSPPGFSGGPLIDHKGKIFGINIAIAIRSHISIFDATEFNSKGIQITEELLKPMLEKAKNGMRRPSLRKLAHMGNNISNISRATMKALGFMLVGATVGLTMEKVLHNGNKALEDYLDSFKKSQSAETKTTYPFSDKPGYIRASDYTEEGYPRRIIELKAESHVKKNKKASQILKKTRKKVEKTLEERFPLPKDR